MATFLSAYQSRFSTQLRTNWSRPQDSSSSTPDTTLETTADTDVVGQFKMVGISPDSTDDRHVAVAVGGIRARLMFYCGIPDWRSEWDGFKDDLKLLTETTSRDRISPTTDSLLEPTQDTLGALPAFDRKEFDNYVTDAPAAGTTQD
jgi:hypothetical protein